MQKATKLYDRTPDQITLDEVERITLLWNQWDDQAVV